MQIATIFIIVKNSKQTKWPSTRKQAELHNGVSFISHQAPLFMGFSRQESCSRLPFFSSRGLPYSGINFRWLSFPNCQIVFIKFCLPSLFKRKNVTEDHANMYKAIGVLSMKRTLWNIDDPSALLLSQVVFHLCALTQYYIWKDKFSL